MLDLELYVDAPARMTPDAFAPFGVILFGAAVLLVAGLAAIETNGWGYSKRKPMAFKWSCRMAGVGACIIAGGLVAGMVLGPAPTDGRDVDEVIEDCYGIESLRYGKDDPMRGVVNWSDSPLPPEGEYKALWASGTDGGEELVHGTLTLLDDKVQLQTDKGKILKPVKAYSIPGRPEE